MNDIMLEEARALASRVGTHPDYSELCDHFGKPEQYPSLARYINKCDETVHIEPWMADRLTRKVSEWFLNDVHDPDLPAAVFRFKYRLDLRATHGNGGRFIERRWSNDLLKLRNGGYDENRIITGDDCYFSEKRWIAGRIYNAGWTWDEKERYPRSKRSINEIKRDMLLLAGNIMVKIQKNEFVGGLSEMVVELEKTIWEGIGVVLDAQWKKEGVGVVSRPTT